MKIWLLLEHQNHRHHALLAERNKAIEQIKKKKKSGDPLKLGRTRFIQSVVLILADWREYVKRPDDASFWEGGKVEYRNMAWFGTHSDDESPMVKSDDGTWWCKWPTRCIEREIEALARYAKPLTDKYPQHMFVGVAS